MLRRALTLLPVVAGCSFTGGSEVDDCVDGSAPLELIEASVANNVARLDVGYGGGCESHEFAVWWTGPGSQVGATNPPTFPLEILHEANGDMCEAYIYTTLYVDLTPLPGDGAYVSFTQFSDGQQRSLGSTQWSRSASTTIPTDGIALTLDPPCADAL